MRLVRRGRELTGLCPFHSEKTPSFTVAEAKGFFHCFGCGKHGNAIDFVMEIEGLSFAEALARLAEQTGLPLPDGGPRGPRIDKTLIAANEAAARWFQGRLEGAGGVGARRYLERRGLDDNTILAFQLGYAPNTRDSLQKALTAEGYDEAQLVAAGLVVRPEDGRATFDRFRDRVMFPIHDQNSRLVGFGGRTLGDAKAKYLNTAETELFHKGELLYGYGHARAKARAEGTVIVVEGYMDVLALARVGLTNTVAPLGTALGETQLRWLWRLADAPLVCLDGDAAGLRAAHRLIERALPLLEPGRSLRFVVLPGGEDPDSMIRAHGADALRSRLDHSVHYLDFLWRAETAGLDLSQPERRAALDRRFRELARTIADRDLRYRVEQALRQRLRAIDARRPDNRAGFRTSQKRVGHQAPSAAVGGWSGGSARLKGGLTGERRRQEAALLAPILNNPELLIEVDEELAHLSFLDADMEIVRSCMIAWYAEQEGLRAEDLEAFLRASGLAELVAELAGIGEPSAFRLKPWDQATNLARWRAHAARLRHFSDCRASGEAAHDAIVRGDLDEQRGRIQDLKYTLEDRTFAGGLAEDPAADDGDRRELEKRLERFAGLANRARRPSEGDESE